MSLDRRLNSDSEWYISRLVDLSVFCERSKRANDSLAAAVGLGALNIDRPIKFEEGMEAEANEEMADLLVKVTNCNPDIARKIIQHDLNHELLRGDDGYNEYDDDSTVYEERNPIENVPPTCSLKTVQCARERTAQAMNPQRKGNYVQDLKYYRYEYAVPLERHFLNSLHVPCASDFVMTCSMPMPNNKIVSGDEARNSRILRAALKFAVRGDTSLMEFRKRIICPCDMQVDIEPGQWLQAPDIANKSHMVLYPSSFIFIHDTFFIDMSSENALDISEPIRTFMAKNPKCFDTAKVKNIEGVKFKDLKLRLGQPYVFQHSGECEHLLIFHDLRLLSPFDEQDVSKYPLIAYQKGGEVYCLSCRKMQASMVVDECSLLPTSPAFLCSGCFREFLFNADGTPVAHFRANHYYPFTKLIV